MTAVPAPPPRRAVHRPIPLDRYATAGVPVPLPRPDYRYPVAYQHEVVEAVLARVRRYRGAYLVASTGLGKTVIATDIARRLRRDGVIERVIVIAPNAVHRAWGRHLDSARLPFLLHNVQALDADIRHSRPAAELAERLRTLDKRWLLIVDECHQLRNRRASGQERRAFLRWLPAVARARCPVLAMTATPFSTRTENLNNQLLLLPHTAPTRALLDEGVEHPRAWRVTRSGALEGLPVTVVATTPRVAHRHGERDAEGVFVRFGRVRKYFPRVALHRVDTPVPLGRPVALALADGLFDAGGEEMPVGGVDRHVRLGLTSSPWALRQVLRRTLATPGPGGYTRARFRRTPEERRVVLEPLLAQLDALAPADDEKLARLLLLLDALRADGDKALVFCERLATVAYLRRALRILRPELRVAATVEAAGDGFRQKEARRIRRLIDDFAPIANDARVGRRGGYDVLIATDAWGLGVNLQDARAVISYDLAWTPIELAQRAGRVLRLWDVPRVVDIHCFVPQLGADVTDRSWRRLWSVVRRWETLLARHESSRRLLDIPTMTRDPRRVLAMDDLAPDALAAAGFTSMGELDLAQLDLGTGLAAAD